MIIDVPLSPRHKIARTGEELAAMVAAVRQARERAIDFETNGLRWANGKAPIGYSTGFVASDHSPWCWYVPFGHMRAEPQAHPVHARQAFNDMLVGAEAIVGHNLKFELNMARAHGYEIPPWVQLHDTLIQGYLIYERRAFDLESLASSVSEWADPYQMKKIVKSFIEQRCRERRMGKEAYLDTFGHSEVPVMIEGEYSCRDIAHSLWLHGSQYHTGKVLLAGSQHEAKRRTLYANEMWLVRAIADMEWNGQLVDAGYLRRQAQALDEDLERRVRELDRMWGASIKWRNDNQLRDFLFNHMRFRVVERTDSGAPSIDRSTLLQLRGFHPEYRAHLEALAEYKAWQKCRTTYTESLADAVCADGRIHASFKQFGTKTGRLSGADPNLQNIPTRHKGIKTLVRRAFYVQDGYARVFSDYSQIELRALAWATGSRTLGPAYRSAAWEAFMRGEFDYDEYRRRRKHEPAVDVHADQARATFGANPGDSDWDLKRRAAKIINFGVPYGMGPPGLNTNPELLLPMEQAKEYFRRYGIANPEIAETKWQLFNKMRSAQGDPRFVNWAGRTVHAPGLLSHDDERRGEAERSTFASLIQGSAGELTRFSLVALWWAQRSGTLPALGTSTVHDEIQLDCRKEDVRHVAAEVQRVMENFHGVFGGVPIVAEIEVSEKTWADKAKYEVHV